MTVIFIFINIILLFNTAIKIWHWHKTQNKKSYLNIKLGTIVEYISGNLSRFSTAWQILVLVLEVGIDIIIIINYV
jgi:hypothetical protein